MATLCGNSRAYEKKITIIDGFCGGGAYIDKDNGSKYYGSPFILIRSIEEGLKIVQEEKGKPNFKLDVEFFFIDSKSEHIECLKNLLKENPPELYKKYPQNFHLICNEFEREANSIIHVIQNKKTSSMFVLDPTGYDDISMQTIRSILALKQSEVLLTFMISYIARFLLTNPERYRYVHKAILEADGYFKELNLDNLSDINQQAYVRHEVLRLFREKGLANFVYSFALLPNISQVAEYYLIHLASNAPAQRVIKESLWKYNNLPLNKRYGFGEHGVGFRTPYYYDRNYSIFDINDENIQASIDCLNNSLQPIIQSNQLGIPFGNLHNSTMQYNPSTSEHYMISLSKLRQYGEIDIIRDGKLTQSRNLKSTDLIRPSNQTKLFDLRPYSNG